MGSSGVVTLEQIIAMLEACAPGYEREEKEHHHWVRYNGRVYWRLPKGAHRHRGARSGRAEIEIGHVRKMVRFLDIDSDCAAQHLPALAG